MSKISFEVNLENVKLDEKQVQQIQKEINAVVARNLVGHVPKDVVFGNKIPRPEWLGFWLKQFKNLDELKHEKDFKQYQLQH